MAIIRSISVDSVRVNQKKLRKLSRVKIADFVRAYERGDAFMPILVEDNGNFYTIREGRHRFQAQLLAGYHSIEVELY